MARVPATAFRSTARSHLGCPFGIVHKPSISISRHSERSKSFVWRTQAEAWWRGCPWMALSSG